MTRRIFLSTLTAAPLFGRGGTKQFPDWDAEFVDRMLTDSPWAHRLNIAYEASGSSGFEPSGFQIGFPSGIPGTGWPGGSRGGTRGGSGGGLPPIGIPGTRRGSTVRTEIFLTLRWASALPMRQAMAIHEYGRHGLDSQGATELLNREEKDYTLLIAGFPARAPEDAATQLEEELKRSATLSIKGRRPVQPLSVAVPPQGMHMAATIRFPRFRDLSESEGLLEVTAANGPMRIAHRFKLKEMVYQGKLEI